MTIVKVHNKARNVTYAYESESYWDKELKQPRSHRKLIGRIDPETGEIVPTGRKTAAKASSAASENNDIAVNYKALYEKALSSIEKKNALILELRSKLDAAEKENASCHRSIRKACDILVAFASGKEKNHGKQSPDKQAIPETDSEVL